MMAISRRLLAWIASWMGLFLLSACATAPQPESFDHWLRALRAEAREQGIRPETLDTAFAGVEPIARVIELDRRQPESTLTFPQYLERITPESRIREGRRLLAANRALLDPISRHYGVPPQYIVALWGIETSYGANTGGFDVIAALATLAWEGRRIEFFRGELLYALHILNEGHIERDAMRGSWAGAMGQSQFMPSSFLHFAVDEDGDGRKDIWQTQTDVFASIAHYLARSGWNPAQSWGWEVSLPPGFDTGLTGREHKRPWREWAALGVKDHNKGSISAGETPTAIVLLDDDPNIAYAVTVNYDVVMKWNRSLYFATSVGVLADRIATDTGIAPESQGGL